jgi:hypothetical protein
MKANIRLPKTRLLTACLLFFSLFLFINRVQKLIPMHPPNLRLQMQRLRKSFLLLPANASLAVKRAAAEMKNEMPRQNL